MKSQPIAKFTLESLKPFLKEFELFTDSKYDFLKSIGGKGRMLLWRNYLQGQYLSYHSLEDKLGRRTVAYLVAKNRQSVAIKSYPLNIWERGYVSKTGKKVAGKGPLKALKKEIRGSKLSKWAEQYLEALFNREP